jgi:hypothetical protein
VVPGGVARAITVVASPMNSFMPIAVDCLSTTVFSRQPPDEGGPDAVECGPGEIRRQVRLVWSLV